MTTRDELVAALELERSNLSHDPERLAEALDAALDVLLPEEWRQSSLYSQDARDARAAFLQSLTGATPRETERP